MVVWRRPHSQRRKDPPHVGRTVLWDDRPSEILIDSIGLGAGVLDMLSEAGLPVRGVNVAETPSASDQYARLRDELWFKGRGGSTGAT